MFAIIAVSTLLPAIFIWIGCGAGRVTIPLAEVVKGSGEVIAVDVQERMLAKIRSKKKRKSSATYDF